MISKYGTKINIQVPSQLIKEHWKDDIIKFTGYKYYAELGISNINLKSKAYVDNLLKKTISKYYKIITYKSFAIKLFGNNFSKLFKNNNFKNFNDDELKT